MEFELSLVRGLPFAVAVVGAAGLMSVCLPTPLVMDAFVGGVGCVDDLSLDAAATSLRVLDAVGWAPVAAVLGATTEGLAAAALPLALGRLTLPRLLLDSLALTLSADAFFSSTCDSTQSVTSNIP